MTVDHYVLLGVTRSATHAEIRTAYRQLAQRLHPDTHGGAVSAEMVAVNEAWRVLSDNGRRSAYDASLYRETASVAAPERAWTPVDPDEDDIDYEDALMGPMVYTAAARRWMVLITFTTIAAGVLLTALFVYAFIRSGSTGH